MVNVPPPHDSKQSRPFMKNSKKFYKHPNKSGRQYFHHDMTDPTAHVNSGENSVNAPAIAIVAPTARNPTHNQGIHSTTASSCKASSAISPHMTAATTSVPRMHVQHHIHHIQPVQISTTLSPPPGSGGAATGVQLAPPQVSNWPVVEPAFHFGPGFEIHQSYCPTHSHNDQHLVLFHIMPGVAVSFQIAGVHKIIQGEYRNNWFQHICRNMCITSTVSLTRRVH